MKNIYSYYNANRIKLKYIIFLLFLYNQTTIAQILEQKTPRNFNVQGTIYDPNGILYKGTASIRFQILDSASTCVLYEETQTGINTALTNGSFTIDLGVSGSRINRITNGITLTRSIFENNKSITVTGCGTISIPQGGDRKLRLFFDTGSGFYQMSPDLNILSLPYAQIAEYADEASFLNGKSGSEYLYTNQNSSPTTALTQSNLEALFANSTHFTNLLSIAATGSAPSSGDANITSGNIGGSTTINTTGSISSSIVSSTINNTQNVRFYEPTNTNYIQLKAPNNLVSTFTLNLPISAGLNNQVLTSDGAGNLNWTSLPIAPVTSVAGKTGVVNLTVSDISGLSTSASVDATNANNITTGTIDPARLPASVKYWDSVTGGINYAGGNVGIGTTTPTNELTVVKNQNLRTVISVNNANNGNAAQSAFVGSSDMASFFLLANSSATGGSTFSRSNSVSLYTSTTTSGGLSLMARDPAGYMTFHTGGNTERMRIDASGNVGVGTTSPDVALEVHTNAEGANLIKASADTHDGVVIGIDSLGTNHQLGKINFNGSTNISGDRGIGGRITANSENDMYQANDAVLQFNTTVSGGGVSTANLYTFNENDSAHMVIGPSGNVGIGTTLPAAKLNIVNSSGISARLEGSFASWLQFYEADNTKVWNLIGDGTNFDLREDGTSNIRLRVAAGGNVGIGTNAPSARLHVVENSTGDAAIFEDNSSAGASTSVVIRSGGTGNSVLKFQGSSTTYADIILPTAANHLRFRSDTFSYTTLLNAQPYLELGIFGEGGRIQIKDRSIPQTNIDLRAIGNSYFNGGNVGVGTTAPTEKLHVVGNILATGTITPSDARFKKNIQSIKNPIEKINQIRGVEYDMRKSEYPDRGFSDRHQLGVIAQEVEKVYPEAVNTSDVDGYKSVNYSMLIAPLIEAVKKIYQDLIVTNQEISILKKNIVNREEFEVLKNENSQLKKYICQKDPSAIFCK